MFNAALPQARPIGAGIGLSRATAVHAAHRGQFSLGTADFIENVSDDVLLQPHRANGTVKHRNVKGHCVRENQLADFPISPICPLLSEARR